MNISKVFSSQWKKSSFGLGWIIASTILYGMSIVSFLIDAFPLYNKHYSFVLPASRMWSLMGNPGSSFKILYDIFLLFALPLLSALIFSDEILIAKKNHVLQLILSRSNRLAYYLTNCAVCFLRTFTTIFFSLSLNQLLWLICCPLQNNHPYTQLVQIDMEFANNLLFPNLFFNNPYIYNLLYIFFISLLAASIAVFSTCLCFVIKNQLQVLIIPSLLYLAQNFICAAVGFYRYSISAVISPFPSVKNISFSIYIVFLISIMSLCVVLFVYGVVVKKDEYE